MITSGANAKVKQAVQWRDKARERRDAGIFLTEGFKLFQEAPGETVREVYLTPEALEKVKGDPGLYRKLQDVGYETVTQEVFRKMSDTGTPQGILCVVTRPSYSWEQLSGGGDPLFVVLESIQDPGNLGTIFRTAEGAGVSGVILGGETADLFSPKAVRATMGSVFRVPFWEAEDLPRTLGALKEQGVRVYAAHLSGKEYDKSFDFRTGTAFLIGNEGNGLRRETAAQADGLLRIPMEGKVESLNAAVAASVLMYEAHRQRHG